MSAPDQIGSLEKVSAVFPLTLPVPLIIIFVLFSRTMSSCASTIKKSSCLCPATSSPSPPPPLLTNPLYSSSFSCPSCLESHNHDRYAPDGNGSQIVTEVNVSNMDDSQVVRDANGVNASQIVSEVNKVNGVTESQEAREVNVVTGSQAAREANRVNGFPAVREVYGVIGSQAAREVNAMNGVNGSKSTITDIQLLPAVSPWDFDVVEAQRPIVPPWEHDIMLLDINRAVLESAVSTILERRYLEQWRGSSTHWPVEGVMFGVNKRLMLSLATSLSKRRASQFEVVPHKVAVHYLLDTGAPTTYLCEDALHALTPNRKIEYTEYARIPVTIQGYKCEVHMSPLTSHFKDVSIIGSDFLAMIHAKLIADYGKAKEFRLVKGPALFESSTDDE